MRQSEMPTTRGGPGQQGETHKSRAHNNFHAGSSPPHGNEEKEKGEIGNGSAQKADSRLFPS